MAKTALVIGCARGVWEEVTAARAMGTFDTIYCVKMAGLEWSEGFFWWITLHPEYMDSYKTMRRKAGLPDDYKIVGPLAGECGRHFVHEVDRRVSYRFKGMTSSGSSGLFGVKVALDDGHDQVVIAGVPMEPGAGHFKRGAEWQQCSSFRLGWEAAMPFIKHKVRSMSGWTKHVLGAPTPGWLCQRDAAANTATKGLITQPEMGQKVAQKGL